MKSWMKFARRVPKQNCRKMELASRLCRRFASLPADAANGADAASLDAFKSVPALWPAEHADELAKWTAFAKDVLGGSDGRAAAAGFTQTDGHLAMRSFVVGHQLTAADFAVWAVLFGGETRRSRVVGQSTDKRP